MNHPFYVYCRYTHLNMRANMTYTIHTMCGPNTKRVWRYDCIPPPKKKNYPKDILSRYDWKTWDIISSSHHPKIPSRFFLLKMMLPRSKVGKSEHLFLGEDFLFGDTTRLSGCFLFQTSYGSVKNRLSGSNYPDVFSNGFFRFL